MPRLFIDEKLAIVLQNWQLNSSEKNCLDSIDIINEKSILVEQNTVGLTEKKECFFVKKAKSYRAHITLIRQRNFESLANEILFSEKPQSVKEKMKQLKKLLMRLLEKHTAIECVFI